MNLIAREGRVRWNRRALMVRITEKSKDKRKGQVWSREDENFEREAEAFV